MKAFNLSACLRNFLIVCLLSAVSLLKVNTADAQPPDCVSGNVAYTVFNDSISSAFSSVLDSIEIRPVNLLTGTVGALMGGKRYWVRKYLGSGNVANDNNYIYGSSALAVDFTTSRFYVMTQMSGSLPKDVMTINPVGGTMTTIATLPSSMDDYHFVKMAAHNSNGYIYAIGVVRDTTLVASDRVNPVVRFQTCGLTPTNGCATGTVQIIGYLANTALTKQWLLFNGDIAFDNSGNMYFATAAFERVNSANRYTDSRLFRINAANLPTTAGTTSIPISLVCDFNTLDSTVINGIGFSGSGNMYITTRRYNGVQNPPLPTFKSELYSTGGGGSATLMPAFVHPTAGTSASDLATCFFPAAVLAGNKIDLNGQYVSGSYNLNWEAEMNPEILYFQVQRSTDGINFDVIDRVELANNNGSLQSRYNYRDRENSNAANVFYRVATVKNNGMRYYSNVVKLTGSRISFSKKITPNPFVDQLELSVHMRIANTIDINLRDQSGRIVYNYKYRATAGENSFKVANITGLKPGVYFIELSTGDEVLREKLIKQ